MTCGVSLSSSILTSCRGSENPYSCEACIIKKNVNTHNAINRCRFALSHMNMHMHFYKRKISSLFYDLTTIPMKNKKTLIMKQYAQFTVMSLFSVFK